MAKDNPFVTKRRDHKQAFLKFIQENKDLDKKKIIGLFSLRTGLSAKVLNVYWEELEDAGIV